MAKCRQICERLVMVNNDLLDHRRALRNTLSLSLEKETNTVILCGVVVYTATDGELLDEEATVTFDWLTTTIKLFCGDNLIGRLDYGMKRDLEREQPIFGTIQCQHFRLATLAGTFLISSSLS